MINYSYDLCGILVGVRTSYDQPRFHAVKDAATDPTKSSFSKCCHTGIFGDF